MKRVEDILGRSAETYAAKNEDYGESWYEIGHILYRMAGEEPVVLDSPHDWIAAGLFTRRFDKLYRSFNGEFGGHDMAFEPAVDADEDEVVYAAMAAANKALREQNEGDQ